MFERAPLAMAKTDLSQNTRFVNLGEGSMCLCIGCVDAAAAPMPQLRPPIGVFALIIISQLATE